MILSGLKLSIANRRARSLPKKEITFGEGRPVEKVGIILDSLDEVVEHAFQDFVQALNIKIGSAEVVYCLPGGQNDISEERTILRGRDISWRGTVTNTRVASFLDRHFDLVVCFTKAETKLVKYLLNAVDARLIVGRQQEEEGLYDLCISSSFEEVEVFTSEVRKYLNILK